MPNQQDGSGDPTGQSVNWLVGLSGAALGGALLKFDWLLKLSPVAKVAVLIASFWFLLSILIGVYYAFQLLAVKARKDELAALKTQTPAPADGTIQHAQAAVDKAFLKARKFHYGTMFTFGLAGLTTIFALAVGLFSPEPPKEPVRKNKYAITTSQVVLNGRVSHSHTFLLNQETGEVWEVVCRSGKLVEFRRVPKTSYDGSAEEPPGKATAAKP